MPSASTRSAPAKTPPQSLDEVKLTSLEAFVLATVDRFQPMTPYAVRKYTASSLSSTFSDSSGSIYPLMRRLETNGLLSSVSSARGKRKHVEYSVTELGHAAVVRWVLPPFDERDFWPMDMFRLRFHNFHLLSRKSQREWLREARAMLTQMEETLVGLPPTDEFGTNEPIIELVRSNVRHLNAARNAWLDEIEAKLDTLPTGKG